MKEKKKKYPSYEDGAVREPEVAELQDPKFTESKLKRLIKKALKKSPTNK